MAEYVHLHGLRKEYRGFRWGPVDMTLEPGFIYAMMGPNGSGKSTLFRLLCGMIFPTQGELRLFGEKADPDRMDVRRRIAYVPEELELPDPSWTFREWMKQVAQWYSDWNQEKCWELADRYDLDADKKIASFSKGMKRKAAFVLAVAQEPDVLLLDEPTSGIDPFSWRLMMEDLSRFMADGTRTILIATHIMEEIRKLADMVVFLHEGKLLGTYGKDELMDRWKMLWIDRLPSGGKKIPGMTMLEPELPARLITDSPEETGMALADLGIHIHQTRSLELDEIFLQLVRMKQMNGNERRIRQ